eukprot:gb/GECG01007692.1/.p1 GENE.gb/GECG01007692.1/~~gb/GECG01007692.1/.p1  ORF type:complete len:715 (+),score=153.38 gb/GECG01007692.1/:1-2145(+)
MDSVPEEEQQPQQSSEDTQDASKPEESEQEDQGVVEETEADTGAEQNTATNGGEEAAAAAPPKEKSLFERMKEKTSEEPWNFDAWTKYLAEAERLSKQQIEGPREAFNAFLAQYPLCFGYWKKFAEAEWRQLKEGEEDEQVREQVKQNTLAVYERGCKAVPYSSEHWLNYANFCKKVLEDREKTKSILYRATSILYLDPRCKALWEFLIAEEKEDGNHTSIGCIYNRVLRIPVQYVDALLKEFKEWAAAEERQPEEICPDDSDTVTEAKAAIDADENYTEKSDEEKAAAVKEKLIHQLQEAAQQSIASSGRRKRYEAVISKRTYYHVNPLDEAVLGAWHDYLDAEESEGKDEHIRALYERCLVATANYGQFWVRYAKWLRNRSGMGEALDVLKRATGTFVPKRPEVLLLLAMIYEELNQIEEARATYEKLEDITGRLLVEVTEAHASFERRHGNEQGARDVFKEAIREASGENLGNKTQSFSEMKTRLFAMQYLLVAFPRFVAYKEPREAAELARQGLLRDKCKHVSRELWQVHLTSLERSGAPFEEISEAYKQALQLYPKKSPPKENEDAEEDSNVTGDQQQAEGGSVDEAEEESTLQNAAEKLYGKDRAALWLRYLDYCRVSAPAVSDVLKVEEQFEHYKTKCDGQAEIDALMSSSSSAPPAGGGNTGGILPPSSSGGQRGGGPANKRPPSDGASNGGGGGGGYGRPNKRRR